MSDRDVDGVHDPLITEYLATTRPVASPDGPVEIDTTVLEYRIDGKQEALVAKWNEAPPAVRVTLLSRMCATCGWIRAGHMCEHQRAEYSAEVAKRYGRST